MKENNFKEISKSLIDLVNCILPNDEELSFEENQKIEMLKLFNYTMKNRRNK